MALIVEALVFRVALGYGKRTVWCGVPYQLVEKTFLRPGWSNFFPILFLYFACFFAFQYSVNPIQDKLLK